MKIKVTFEREFDSDEFYNGASPEDLEDLTFEQFREGLIMELQDYPEDIIEYLEFEEIKE